nr:Endoglin CD105 antigen domain containing protein [Haemonchus contortus]
MPLCTYTIRRESINGPVVQFAQVGDQVFHVWQCESDMFSMLVHSCFVDDSNGQERKPFIDEYGCAIDPIIVPDLVYNKENNLAFSQVNVFKFADKPPRCGPFGLKQRPTRSIADARNSSRSRWIRLGNTMDVSAQKITVLDLEEAPSGTESAKLSSQLLSDPISTSHASKAAVCFSPQIAVVFSLIATLSTIATAILASLLIMRFKTRKIFE